MKKAIEAISAELAERIKPLPLSVSREGCNFQDGYVAGLRFALGQLAKEPEVFVLTGIYSSEETSKVFCLTYLADMECHGVCGIYSSREKAEDKIASQSRQKQKEYAFDIEEWEVDVSEGYPLSIERKG